MTDYCLPLGMKFKALADPRRRSIIERLTQRPGSAREFAEALGLHVQTVLQHIAILEEAGLIVSRKVGRRRECALQSDAFLEVHDWLNRVHFGWDDKLARLEASLQAGENHG